MKYLRYLALVSVLMLLPLAYAQAEVHFRVGVAVSPGYVAYGPRYVVGPPVCTYGYYDYYPYACAPYGYYGPQWFVNGVFVGAGPWYHPRAYYYGHRFYDRDWDHRYYARGYYRRGFDRDDFIRDRDDRFESRGFAGRGHEEREFRGDRR